MLKSNLEKLSDIDLEKKHQNREKIAKITATLFIAALLLAIGYAGYASAKGYEQPFSVFKSGWVAFLGSIHMIVYCSLYPISKEIAQRKNNLSK